MGGDYAASIYSIQSLKPQALLRLPNDDLLRLPVRHLRKLGFGDLLPRLSLLPVASRRRRTMTTLEDQAKNFGLAFRWERPQSAGGTGELLTRFGSLRPFIDHPYPRMSRDRSLMP